MLKNDLSEAFATIKVEAAVKQELDSSERSVFTFTAQMWRVVCHIGHFLSSKPLNKSCFTVSPWLRKIIIDSVAHQIAISHISII